MTRRNMDRRRFIGCAGGLLAAAALSGCQSTGSPQNAPGWGNEPEQERSELRPTDLVDVEVKDSVEDYTWDELSEISQAISDAEAHAGDYGFFAEDVATAYNLCAAGGALDGSQTKSFVFTDADGQTSTVEARIIGFAHDDCADGDGKAGITFLLTSSLGVGRIGPEGKRDNTGGWRDSVARTFLNDELLEGFPEDLLAVIVPVAKMTNNQGEGDTKNKIAPNEVTETRDTLWLLSAVEVLGGFNSDNIYTETLDKEGRQYRYFEDLGLDGGYFSDEGCEELVLGEKDWWLRSPMPTSDDMFCTVAGEQWESNSDETVAGSVTCLNANAKEQYVPAFCV